MEGCVSPPYLCIQEEHLLKNNQRKSSACARVWRVADHRVNFPTNLWCHSTENLPLKGNLIRAQFNADVNIINSQRTGSQVAAQTEIQINI